MNSITTTKAAFTKVMVAVLVMLAAFMTTVSLSENVYAKTYTRKQIESLKKKTKNQKKIKEYDKALKAKVIMDETYCLVEAGKSYYISYRLTETKYNKVKFSSSNNNVVTVDKNGIITTKNPGRAVITAKTTIGNKKDTLIIDVQESEDPYANWWMYEDEESEIDFPSVVYYDYIDMGISKIIEGYYTCEPYEYPDVRVEGNSIRLNEDDCMFFHMGAAELNVSIIGEGESTIIITAPDGNSERISVIVR